MKNLIIVILFSFLNSCLIYSPKPAFFQSNQKVQASLYDHRFTPSEIDGKFNLYKGIYIGLNYNAIFILDNNPINGLITTIGYSKKINERLFIEPRLWVYNMNNTGMIPTAFSSSDNYGYWKNIYFKGINAGLSTGYKLSPNSKITQLIYISLDFGYQNAGYLDPKRIAGINGIVYIPYKFKPFSMFADVGYRFGNKFFGEIGISSGVSYSSLPSLNIGLGFRINSKDKKNEK